MNSASSRQPVADERHLLEAYKTHLSPNYADFLERFGLAHTVREAVGSRIVDSQGKNYLDFTSSYGVVNLGHNPPSVVAALRRELDSNPLWNRPFLNAPLANLAERLVGLTGGTLDKVFVCSTGAEAIDSALKLARLATRRTRIVAATGAFHGFTLGALSVSGIPGQSNAYEPLLQGIDHVPYGDVAALTESVTKETAAVLLEPIQAEIGSIEAPEGYLRAARRICDREGSLLIIDEVRTGMGRTGPMFAVEHEQVVPDVLVIGKSLGGGIVPIGAMLAKANIWKRFGLTFSMTASSFAGNRLACVAASAVVETFSNENLLDRGRAVGALLWEGLMDLPKSQSAIVRNVTGRGLLIGIHFANPALANYVIRECISRGLLVAAAFCDSRCILLEPALVLGREQAEQSIETFKVACQKAKEALT